MAFTEQQLDEISRTQEARGLTRKAALQYCTRLWKRNAVVAGKEAPAAPAQEQHKPKAVRQAVAKAVVVKEAKVHKPASKSAQKQRPDFVAPKLKAADPLPEATVLKLWKEGKSLTAIAQAVGTGTRPDGSGFRIGRIRRLLQKAGVYGK
jgi:hypothetical protein